MYITHVQKIEDEKDVENCKGGADGILIFTGLFSSTVASFIALSYPNLQQDPNVTTQALLAQISQQLSVVRADARAIGHDTESQVKSRLASHSRLQTVLQMGGENVREPSRI
ncbi:hypothetical protein H4582DRAFT_2215154 [Lactarius indigo]|nr:hypothetical protein H4582DRAFT_2215154 [Lactarius indigo]